MRKTYLFVPILLAAGLAFALSPAGTEYRLAGEYFETCSCDPACPCIFNSDPTQGFCNATLIWHIGSGQRGEVSLDGLNVVVTLSAAGHMGQQAGQWRGVLYLDERASPAQRKALAEIYSSRFGSLFAEMAGPKAVPIEFTRNGNNFSVRIPDVLDAAIEPITNRQGKVTTISHAPFEMVGKPLSAGRSVKHHYADADLDSWDYSGRNAFFADFEYASGGN